jgi:hypothetical protein
MEYSCCRKNLEQGCRLALGGKITADGACEKVTDRQTPKSRLDANIVISAKQGKDGRFMWSNCAASLVEEAVCRGSRVVFGNPWSR